VHFSGAFLAGTECFSLRADLEDLKCYLVRRSVLEIDYCSRVKKHLIPEILMDDLHVTASIISGDAFRITNVDSYLQTNVLCC
jgi:hypothetical protein